MNVLSLASCTTILGIACLAGCAGVNTTAILLPEENNAASAITVGAGGSTVVVDTPFKGATVGDRGQVEPVTLTEAEVKRIFGDALSAQPPRAVSFTLYFDTNSTEVNAASRPALDALLNEVAQRQAAEVVVIGHTDRVGSVEDNDRLSLVRAEAVRAMLVQRGIQASFIRAVGRGEREPLIPTADEQPEPRNRRVEVIVR